MISPLFNNPPVARLLANSRLIAVELSASLKKAKGAVPPRICSFAFPVAKFAAWFVVAPKTIMPLWSTTIGVLSGFAASSTNSALPVPVCVIRKASLVPASVITTPPACSYSTDLLDGYVTKTVTVPENVSALPELLEERIVVRVSVGPVVEYVPIPTSQLPAPSVAE